ncbi:MAG: DGQHR domain-containing protein DpdB [bacterium]
MKKHIETRAIQVIQGRNLPVFSFFLSGNEILTIADISRINKGSDGELLGYQREEVRKHVDEIAGYLGSEDAIMPHAIILALSSEVKFKQSRGPQIGNGSEKAGVLTIPVREEEGKRAAWIVDGQQRTLALTKANSKGFRYPVPVTAFVTDDFEIHRSQFLLVNKVKPLPKGLINELLPTVNTALPPSLAKNKIPSALCDLLNRDPDSPFYQLIIRQTTDKRKDKTAVITDTGLLEIIKESLNKPHGCLYQHRNVSTGEIDIESVHKTLNIFWEEVKTVFPDAWGLPSKESRLMHGVGIRAMGILMDRILGNLHPDDPTTKITINKYLKKLKPHCAWTRGTWEILDGVPWNSLQNTSRDFKRLSLALIQINFNSA